MAAELTVQRIVPAAGIGPDTVPPLTDRPFTVPASRATVQAIAQAIQAIAPATGATVQGIVRGIAAAQCG